MRSHLMKCRFVAEAVREQLRSADHPRAVKKAKKENLLITSAQLDSCQQSFANNYVPVLRRNATRANGGSVNESGADMPASVANPVSAVDATAVASNEGEITPIVAKERKDVDAGLSEPTCGRRVPPASKPLTIVHVPPGVVVRFLEPRIVESQQLPRVVELRPMQVLVRTQVSAVSAGTEMLVYRGQMPVDLPTDSLLAGEAGTQASEPFSYPASYGYATVGTIVACGSSVPPRLAVDTAVFAFREHSSWFVANCADLQVVPDAVALSDATFLPNVETALSLAMDAAPLPGENVAVVGQGIVGLLLVAVLKLCYGKTRVIAIDTLADRLLVSLGSARPDSVVLAKAGRGTPPLEFDSLLRAALPASDSAGVDVAIDVSGHESGLDTAIRATRNGGRVVVGSWFGAKDVTLSCLGGRFHRSHINIVASQVSSIPAKLSSRWDKGRRFRLAWDMLPSLSPSTRFPVSRITVSDAARAYAEIDRGMHIQVLFDYNVSVETDRTIDAVAVQPAQLARLAPLTQPASPPQPARSAHPVQLSKPVQSIVPTATTQPAPPFRPAQPAQPVQPVQPIQVGQAQLVEAVRPVQALEPVEQARLAPPAEPVSLQKPAQSQARSKFPVSAEHQSVLSSNSSTV
jgi:NADPH:quinone reductase-like Zn-dependent oxidoreductase